MRVETNSENKQLIMIMMITLQIDLAGDENKKFFCRRI